MLFNTTLRVSNIHSFSIRKLLDKLLQFQKDLALVNRAECDLALSW